MSLKTEAYLRSRDNNVLSTEGKSKDSQEAQLTSSYHKMRDSLFSSPSFSNLNNKGISNVCLVILVLSNASLAIENISKYGNFLNLLWIKIYFTKLIEVPSLLILSGLNIFALSSLGLEVLLSKGILNDKISLVLASLLLAFEILIPPFTIYAIDSFAICFTIIVCYITVFLKLISYHMVNYWCRQNIISNSKSHQHNVSVDESKEKDLRSGDKDKSLIQYPNNLNLKDMYYFLFAPTLCYELNFPLLPHIRKHFLIKRVLELMFLLILIISIIQQIIIPIVTNYQDTFQSVSYIEILEVYFKLTIPFYSVWVLCFCFIFHSWLNIIGEILRFGDRHFYGDWWNAEILTVWWRKWNIPVHNWCLRHIYKPMLQSGYTKFQAICVVFFVSGVFHEYLFSLPLKIFKILMFVSICFGQITYFAFVSDQPSKFGNLSQCLNVILFQPVLLLYYYYGFYVEHYQNMEINL